MLISTELLRDGTVVRAAEALGRPTDGPFAASLWESLSHYQAPLPCAKAAQVYRDCGYIPFAGYPLSRYGRIDRMTREEVKWELDWNPLCRLFKGGW